MTASEDPHSDRVMIDLETLGTEPGCSILSIGAVKFDENGLGETFYRSVSRESCSEYGLEEDEDTLEWWDDRDEDVSEVLEGGTSLADTLEDFAVFYGAADEIWAYSPAFDCAILSAAYDAVSVVQPWDYWQERCARTVSNLPVAPDLEQKGDEHHALDDGYYQARVVSGALQRMEAEVKS